MTNIFPNSLTNPPRDSSCCDPQSSALQWEEELRNGTTVLIRPIDDNDAELERRFIEELSPQSRRYRFLGAMKSPSPELLTQFTHIDSTHDAAFVALLPEGANTREIGVARYSARPDGVSCECAVVVSDAWHNQGLATLLMQHLIDVARRHGIESMYSMDAVDNQAMRDLASHLGFQRAADPNDIRQVIHTLDLTGATA